MKRNDEYYLKITVHDNDFSNELRMLGEYLELLINFYDIDFMSLGDKFGDDYILIACKKIFLETHEIQYDNNNGDPDKYDDIYCYLDDKFEIGFLLESEITDGNQSNLYIQLSGKNKGYHFIY